MRLCVFVGSRANYGRLKSVIKIAHEHKDIDLKLIIGASGLWTKIDYPHETVECLVNADTTSGMCLTAGLLLTQITGILKRIQPDCVLIHGDRYEVLSVAIASSYQNITLAHTEGGDVTGTIDDKVRDAITALADIHFPVTDYSADRIYDIVYGECNKEVMRTAKCGYIYTVGSTALDGLNPMNKPGDYVVILHHPNTTDPEDINPLIEAVKSMPYKKVWVNPNVDAGAKAMLKRIHYAPAEFVKDLSPDEYIDLIYNARCCIGNSSSFIKEGAYLGIPAVLVGNRQEGRETGNNVIQVDMNESNILRAAYSQIGHGRYKPDYRFGDGTASEKIIKILAEG
ncbi:MAG: UDP-N-acetylglucosamine 2-epimerase (hydrolyzing) [Deltaproteobacteria bacterium]|nr:UDP-N-acetylglucosamine 2-epimerase (hydrolyzing) [Deltaproteobacteria bacterium]